MTIDISSWLGVAPAGSKPVDLEAQRAALAWRRINDKPTSVAFRTPAGVTLAAQTVRLEYDTTAALENSAAGTAPRMPLIIFGVRNYGGSSVGTITAGMPIGLLLALTYAAAVGGVGVTTNMEEGYRFVHEDDEYTIRDIIETIGERQALAVAVG